MCTQRMYAVLFCTFSARLVLVAVPSFSQSLLYGSNLNWMRSRSHDADADATSRARAHKRESRTFVMYYYVYYAFIGASDLHMYSSIPTARYI